MDAARLDPRGMLGVVHRDRHGADRDIEERSVLPASAGHELDGTIEDPVVQRGGFVADRFVPTHQLVDVATSCFRTRPPEQALRSRVPLRDQERRVARDDGRRTRLDERLVEASLVLGVADRCFGRRGHRGEA